MFGSPSNKGGEVGRKSRETERLERRYVAEAREAEMEVASLEEVKAGVNETIGWVWDEETGGWMLPPDDEVLEEEGYGESLSPGQYTGQTLLLKPSEFVEAIQALSPGERLRAFNYTQTVTPERLNELKAMSGSERGKVLQGCSIQERTAVLKALNAEFVQEREQSVPIVERGRSASRSMRSPSIKGNTRSPSKGSPDKSKERHRNSPQGSKSPDYSYEGGYEGYEAFSSPVFMDDHRGSRRRSPSPEPTNELVKVHLSRPDFLQTKGGNLPPPPPPYAAPPQPKPPLTYDLHGRRLDPSLRRPTQLLYPDVQDPYPAKTNIEKISQIPPRVFPGYIDYSIEPDEDDEPYGVEDVMRIGPVTAHIERGVIGKTEPKVKITETSIDRNITEANQEINARLRSVAMSDAKEWAARQKAAREGRDGSKSPTGAGYASPQIGPRSPNTIISPPKVASSVRQTQLNSSKKSPVRKKGRDPEAIPRPRTSPQKSTLSTRSVAIASVPREITIQTLPQTSTGLQFSALKVDSTPPGTRQIWK